MLALLFALIERHAVECRAPLPRRS
jgi:hypothetical protein